MTNNKPKFDFNLIYILIVIVLVNIISYFMFSRFDFTEGKIYSLSDASKKLVSGLEDRVIVKCFFSKELPPQLQIIPAMVKNNLDEYQTYSNGNFHYEFIDPSNPDFSEQIMNYQLPSAQVQMLEKDEFKVKRVFMGMVILYGDKKEIIPFIQEGDLSSLEYEITSRIRKITLDKLPVVGILSGYGSSTAEDIRTAYNILSSQYVVKAVSADTNSLTTDKVDALLIIGPEEDLPEEALNAIDSYVMSGGKTGFFIDKTRINLKTLGVEEINTNIDSLMMSYGVKVNNDLVGDRQAGFISVRQQKGFFSISNQIKYPFLPQVTNLSKKSNITQRLDAVNFYFTSSLDTSFAEGKNIDLEIIARTSENSFTQSKNYYIMADRDINDYKYSMSKIPLAALMTGSFTSFADSTRTGIDTRIAVTGDAEFFQDGKFNSENDMNLFLNIVDWLTADDSLISIRSKSIAVRPLKELSEGKKSTVKWLNIISIPFLIILLGLIKWRKNRTRKDFSL